jgi:hypothetical protein
VRWMGIVAEDCGGGGTGLLVRCSPPIAIGLPLRACADRHATAVECIKCETAVYSSSCSPQYLRIANRQVTK